MNLIDPWEKSAALDLSKPGVLDKFFPGLTGPVTRRRLSKAALRRRRLAKRNAVLLALAADRTGTGRAIARALHRELRRHAAGRRFRSADADARASLLRRFITLNAGNPLSEAAIRGVLAGNME